MEFYKENKRKIIVVTVIIIVVLILFLVKSCSKKTETKNKAHYLTHLTKSLDVSAKSANKVLDYFGGIESIADCDEDAAKQIESFAKEFEEESKRYHSLTYIGDEDVNGVEDYHLLSKEYDSISTHLYTLSNAIIQKDEKAIIDTFELLKESFETINERGSN